MSCPRVSYNHFRAAERRFRAFRGSKTLRTGDASPDSQTFQTFQQPKPLSQGNPRKSLRSHHWLRTSFSWLCNSPKAASQLEIPADSLKLPADLLKKARSQLKKARSEEVRARREERGGWECGGADGRAERPARPPTARNRHQNLPNLPDFPILKSMGSPWKS